MLGYAHAAGCRDGTKLDTQSLASYFAIPEERFTRALKLVESAERPEILLLQNFSRDAKVNAAVFFSSVWSQSYSKVGNPYGHVHRDFHYQVIFSALATLAEVGCNRVRIDHPMTGYPWRRDAYICALEASRNIRKHMNRGISVSLQEHSYAPSMAKNIEENLRQFSLQEHRPVGISPYVFEGINMRTIFVEKALPALRAARGLSPFEAGN